jgi:hypothetical protein
MIGFPAGAEAGSGAGGSPGVVWTLAEDFSPDNDGAHDVAVDSDGSIFAVGYQASNQTGQEVRIQKILPNGSVEWAVPLRISEGFDDLWGVEPDGLGGAVTAGYDSLPGNNQMGLMRFGTDGDKVWAVTINLGGGDDMLLDVAIDRQGCVVAVGTDEVSSRLGRPDTQWRVVKLDGSGRLLWTWADDPSVGTDVAWGVATDVAGRIYVAGYDESPGPSRWRVVALEADGTPRWNWSSDPSSGWDAATSIAVDQDGLVHVAGYDSLPGFFRWRVAGLSNNGTLLWDWNIDDSRGPGIAYSIDLDGEGNIYIGGIDTAPGGGQRRVVKLASDRTVRWEWTEDPSPGIDSIYSVEVLRDGELVTAGYDSIPGNREWRIQLLAESVPESPLDGHLLAWGAAAAAASAPLVLMAVSIARSGREHRTRRGSRGSAPGRFRSAAERKAHRPNLRKLHPRRLQD